ncbi:hypothetical protein NDU88_001892 [Pleurodeles waltl]|uniref:Uncharacterized protein n=1 Tax=Pleurodeles waltl TaxID=8319 RepID=A0AAV7TKG5_PLEWA|nr:hypothetical protein NDU88_001892 [Pleurodeles waltl]
MARRSWLWCLLRSFSWAASQVFLLVLSLPSTSILMGLYKPHPDPDVLPDWVVQSLHQACRTRWCPRGTAGLAQCRPAITVSICKTTATLTFIIIYTHE